ncbi:NACHT domain-containing protein [Pseudomonas viridiflava]|uniref:NACHT domain-containing protein n=1 Tax=Pseudomonas viridiflava TaxID=33069 RepID=UPI002EC26ADC|nr:NACHT domain-containing protein [Pseudomonas viridiflava]
MFTEAAVTGYVVKNFDKILTIAKSAYQKIDEEVSIALKTAYSEYLTNASDKYSKSKSFFLRDTPVGLYEYYVPIGIFGSKKPLSEPTILTCIENSNRIVISGTGGTGKSVLMKHLFLDCIDSKVYAPIMIELRDLNDSDVTLSDYIESTLSAFGFSITGGYVEKAKKAGHFCFLLDGYDEVNHSKRKKLIKEITQLSDRYKKCPIILSSRPDEAFNGLENFSVFHIMPLTLDSAASLVSKLPTDPDIKAKFLKDLHDKLFEEHVSFLSNPLLLSIMLITYGENSEIPSKLSIFYNQAFDALFRRHDAYKGGYSRGRLTKLDSQDFARIFSLFCLQTYDKREFKMSRSSCLAYIDKSRKSLGKDFEPESYLQDLLGAACLLMEEGLDIGFSHRSFQEYFVALHISTAAPEVQEKLIRRYWLSLKSDSVIPLLFELNPELVERVLLIPQLETLFSDLNVTKKVGITHAVKFFKKTYKSINIDRRGLTASASDSQATVADLLPLLGDSGGYKFPNSDVFRKFDEEIVKKYGDDNESVRLLTSGMSHNTPLLKEIIKFEGRFSMKYLQSAYIGYKKLKVKHSNRLETLDTLLGI